MENKEENKNQPNKQGNRDDIKGYPLYPASDDIYNKSKVDKDINPEDISKTKPLNENEKSGKNNEKDFSKDMSGKDLDVPGSELDDKDEDIGNEDEENNYYSLGGDEHDE